MNILQAEDAVNGREGIATADINGDIIELMELANINITIEKSKTEFKAMGTRNTQNKTTGWKGTGTANVRYVSTRWAKLMEQYIKTGKDTYFKRKRCLFKTPLTWFYLSTSTVPSSLTVILSPV